MTFDIFQPVVDRDKYFIVTYFLESTLSLENAAWNLAIGQSVGNPNVRNEWESDELFAKHSCIVLEEKGNPKLQTKFGTVKIAFPLSNIDMDGDGISQLLCHIMGGQLDIDSIVKCHVIDIEFPSHVVQDNFWGPHYGLEGIRKFTGVYDKPLLGGIVKPKVCMNEDILLDQVKALVEGGVNFIKEDEIMSNPACCPLERRVPKIANYLDGKNVVYCFCINSDPSQIVKRAMFVHENGGNGIHVNFWSGFGAYQSIRKLNLPLFMHFQKSGDKILTNKTHAFHIEWNVICKLAGLIGVDFIHNGMWGGYSSSDNDELTKTIETLHSRQVMPALSCGMHPGLVQTISRQFGNNLLLNTGGAIHGHPGGTKAGARAMRQAIDGTGGEEYDAAIAKWGLVK